MEDPEPMMYHNEVVWRDEEKVGYIRAASYGHTLGAAVGLAMVAPGIGFAVGPFLSGILYSTSMNLPFIFILPLYFLLIIIIRKLELIN